MNVSGLLNRHRGNPIVGSNPTVSANEPFQTLQIHDPDAKIPGVSAGLRVRPQPLRPLRARNLVSKARPSHSDPT